MDSQCDHAARFAKGSDSSCEYEGIMRVGDFGLWCRVCGAVSEDGGEWLEPRFTMAADDALRSIKAHVEPQPSALAVAIVRTCDSALRVLKGGP